MKLQHWWSKYFKSWSCKHACQPLEIGCYYAAQLMLALLKFVVHLVCFTWVVCIWCGVCGIVYLVWLIYVWFIWLWYIWSSSYGVLYLVWVDLVWVHLVGVVWVYLVWYIWHFKDGEGLWLVLLQIRDQYCCGSSGFGVPGVTLLIRLIWIWCIWYDLSQCGL